MSDEERWRKDRKRRRLGHNCLSDPFNHKYLVLGLCGKDISYWKKPFFCANQTVLSAHSVIKICLDLERCLSNGVLNKHVCWVEIFNPLNKQVEHKPKLNRPITSPIILLVTKKQEMSSLKKLDQNMVTYLIIHSPIIF